MPRWAPALVLALVVLCVPPPAESARWSERMDAARAYVPQRAGVESFALVDDLGRLHDYRGSVRAPSASLLKAMLLVAYLNRDSVRGRALTDSDRNLLAPMIRWSDNGTATTTLSIVGASGVYRVARRGGMRGFSLRSPWGASLTSARDQARFFYRIDRLVPPRHRRYALRLLASIVTSQRWGIPPAKPPYWRIYFKGGWGSGTGAVTHQSALLRRGDKRIALSVMTVSNPSHSYGTATIRGVARRVLQRPLPLARELRHGTRSRLSHPDGCGRRRG